MDDAKDNKYQLAEYRLSIYGRSKSEWDTLSAWVVDNDLFSSEGKQFWSENFHCVFINYSMQ